MGSSIQVINAIRANGAVHHYRIASGISWLIEHFPEDAVLAQHFESVAALPDKQGCRGIVTAVLAILRDRSNRLGPVKHSAIFTVLNEALSELQ